MVKLVHLTTVPQSLKSFFAGQLAYMKDQGFAVTAVSSPSPMLNEFARDEGIPSYAVLLHRRVAPLGDIVALSKLWRLFRRLRPDIVHAHTPKAGLLGMLAATLTGVPVRIYHIHGLPYMTASGFMRRLLLLTEKISCFLSTRVLCVSRTIREVVVAQKICPEGKIKSLQNGTINGIDAQQKFNPTRLPEEHREQFWRHVAFLAEGRVIGYVGRLVRDKGIVDLYQAWLQLRSRYDDLHLLLVGSPERKNAVPDDVMAALHKDPRVCFTGSFEDVAPAYAVMDVLVLPTHREGFGLVAAEAGAMGLPVVATDIPGCRDAVIDGVTGQLVPPENPKAIECAVARYLDDPGLREKHGRSGRERIEKEFKPEEMWKALYAEYLDLLDARQPLSAADNQAY